MQIAQSSKAAALVASLGAVIAAPTAGSAQSSDYPSQRISFIVGFAVGGFADTIARWVAIRLGERTGQTVVVQNMEGGGGVRAARRVAMSPPDGYTILVTTTSLTINESLVPNRGYTADAFDAVSLPVSAPESLSASVKSPIKTLAELVKEAKSGTVFMGSAGIGSGSHIAGEYFFKVLAKAPVKHIPFPGGNPPMVGPPYRRRDGARRHGHGSGAQCQQRRRDRAGDRGDRTLTDAAVRSDLRRSRLSRIIGRVMDRLLCASRHTRTSALEAQQRDQRDLRGAGDCQAHRKCRPANDRSKPG